MVQAWTTGAGPFGPSTASWDLVAAAQGGDRQAFGQLYQRYAPEVTRFVLSRTGDRLLAEDLTSETFLRALRRIDSVTDQGRDVGAWLTVIARNLIIDDHKSVRFQQEHPTGALPETGTDSGDWLGPEQVVIQRDTAISVARWVAQLPPAQRQCLWWRLWRGLSTAETAAAMGRTETAVRALRHRAVRTLAELLPPEVA